MSKYIIGITGCPTGIAHTFMAKESIEKAANSLGYKVKVETNGQEGRKNEITYEDLKNADALIVAADIGVDVERFLNFGVPVLQTTTKNALNENAAKKLINDALSLNPEGSKSNIPEDKVEKITIGQKIYKDLMSGVSNMLPFVVGGGILIALSFLWGIFSADPTNAQYNEFAAMLMKIGQQAFGIMVPVFTAYIAYSIAGRSGLVAGFVGGLLANETGAGFLGGIIAGFFAGYLMYYVGKLLSGFKREYEGLKSIFLMPLIGIFVTGMFMLILGKPVAGINEFLMSWLSGLQNTNPIILGVVVGMMCAFDFGGPVNKAAYVTGTILLAQGNFYFMAGVSAACITPPLIIALATTLFKKGFNEDERAAGFVNYILGATHITEGAIPFVAKDPLRMIPIMMIGSSISAVLSYMLLITVPAPHGGFLILPLVNKPIIWVLCILTGSLVGAVLMGLYKIKIAKKTNYIEKENISNEIENVAKNDVIEEIVSLSFNRNNTSIIEGKIKKEDVLKDIAEDMKKQGLVNIDYMEALEKREIQSNTYLEKGIALPHGSKDMANNVIKTGIVVRFIPEGVDWGNGNIVRLAIGIAANNQEHLSVLSKVTTLLSDEYIEEKILRINNIEDLLQLLSGEYVIKTEIVKLENKETDECQTKSEMFTVINPHGLHARPCSNLVKELKEKFKDYTITFQKEDGDIKVNAKSIMHLMKIGIKKGDNIIVEVSGKEPDLVLSRVSEMFKNKFGEN